jgi:hypothetical protein
VSCAFFVSSARLRTSVYAASPPQPKKTAIYIPPAPFGNVDYIDFKPRLRLFILPADAIRTRNAATKGSKLPSRGRLHVTLRLRKRACARCQCSAAFCGRTPFCEAIFSAILPRRVGSIRYLYLRLRRGNLAKNLCFSKA